MLKSYLVTFDFTTIPILETERLRLRRISESDLEDWVAVMRHEAVRRYLVDLEYDEHNRHEIVREIIDWVDAIIDTKSGIRWAITHKPDDQMIGSCGFHLYSPTNRRVEIGYELHPDYWRQGIMREAVTAVIDFCFNGLQVHRIEADVTVGNEASAGLLKRLGFIHEGTWRERVYAHGKHYSLWQFGLLEHEWNSES